MMPKEEANEHGQNHDADGECGAQISRHRAAAFDSGARETLVEAVQQSHARLDEGAKITILMQSESAGLPSRSSTTVMGRGAVRISG